MRELEAQLEDERKQRQAAQSAQKKVESELQELENQLEAEAKGKDDAQRHYKKLHVSDTHTHTHTSPIFCFHLQCVLASFCVDGNTLHIQYTPKKVPTMLP